MAIKRTFASTLLVAAAAAHLTPAQAALPRVDIHAASAIADGAKTPARMVVRGANGYRGRIGIELRGSASRRLAKKSYAFETRSRGRRGRDVALLGMPAENDWILNAAHSDRTLTRDALAYATARRLGRWAPRTRFVELRIDGRYQGVYVLTEQVKLDRARVDVPRKGISGGYVVELSSTPLPGGFTGPMSGRFYGHKDPDRGQLKRKQATWIADYLAGAERALAARDGGWRGLVDERAAVDYLLLQELFSNQDAFSRSTFMAKGTARPLELGPVWDFDRSMGLTLHTGTFGVHPHGWITPGRPLARDLLADAAFADELVVRWREMRAGGLLEDMTRQLAHNRRLLQAPQARNARRWPVTRTPSHASEIDRLHAWLLERVRWIDANIQTLRTPTR